MARGARSGGRLDSGLLIACIALGVFALVMQDRVRDQVTSALRQSVLSPFVALESRAAALSATITSRNDVLTTRGRLATQALLVQGVMDENDTLRRLLGLGGRLQSDFAVAELLPSRGVDDDFTLALNVGASAGVVPFSPIVTADGLVGMVQSTDANTSFAITWAHPDFRVSAMSVDEGAFGIVQPHLGAGADRWLLELRGVPFRATLDTGTLIVSSGLGATYPRGIPVGTVLAEITTPEKWARTYLLRPAVLPKAIGPVIVLGNVHKTRGVNLVWTNVASSDSAARAIAAAGDSVARQAALAELAARRAALDSTGADTLAFDSLGRRIVRPDSMRSDSGRAARPRPDSARARPTGPPPLTPRPGPPSGPPPPDAR